MMDGNLEEQHQRTVELMESLMGSGELTLHGFLYLIHDTQSAGSIKRLAKIAATRPKKIVSETGFSEIKSERDALAARLERNAHANEVVGELCWALESVLDSIGAISNQDELLGCGMDAREVKRVFSALKKGRQVGGQSRGGEADEAR